MPNDLARIIELATAEMNSVASLFVHGEIALLHNGATRGGYRNRGAQSALLTARAQAAEAGCRWLSSEAAKPDEGETNPSLNNLIRSGLNPL